MKKSYAEGTPKTAEQLAAEMAAFHSNEVVWAINNMKELGKSKMGTPEYGNVYRRFINNLKGWYKTDPDDAILKNILKSYNIDVKKLDGLD